MKLIATLSIVAILASSAQYAAAVLPKVSTISMTQNSTKAPLVHLTRRHSADSNECANGPEDMDANAAVEEIRSAVANAVSHQNWPGVAMIINEKYKRFSHEHQHLGTNPLPSASETFLDLYICNPSNPDYDSLIRRYDLGHLNVPRPGDPNYDSQVPQHGVELMNLGFAVSYCIQAALRNNDMRTKEFLEPLLYMLEDVYANVVMSN